MAKGKAKFTISDSEGYAAMQEARRQAEKNLNQAPQQQNRTAGLERMLNKVHAYAGNAKKWFKQ
jgi:hypothetical protein